MGPFDYGSLIRQGQAIVPDYGAEQMQRREMGLREQQAQTQAQALQLRTQEAQQQIDQQGRYQARLTEVMANPTADGIARLQMEFPDVSEGIKRGWDVLDESRKTADLRQISDITIPAGKGDYTAAAERMEARIKADVAADGQADEDDQRILEMLKSDDPAARKMAVTLMSGTLLAIGGDKAKALLGEVLPKPDYSVNNGIVTRQQGDDFSVVGQLPGAGIRTADGVGVVNVGLDGVPVIGGGSVQLPSQQGGGDQASGGAGGSGGSSAPRSVPKLAPLDLKAASAIGGQFGTVTSTTRTPEHNRKVGGVPNSWHVKGRAIDIARKPGVSHAQIVESYKRAGYQVIEQLDEGDHSHLAFAAGPSQTGGPTPVRSKQQFDRLASGTRFIAPDGTVRIKP